VTPPQAPPGAFKVTRLRAGEVIAGLGGVLMLVFMFALKWYGLNARLAEGHAGLPGATAWNGWNELPLVRWLLLLTGLCAILLAFFQATRAAPALPVALSVIVTVLGGLSTVALVVRVLIAPPALPAVGSLDRLTGAYLGLIAAAAIAYGGYASMRQEGGPDPTELGELETIRL
jgi:hypothetical protein